MKPKVQSIDGLVQLRYRLPYQVRTSQVYPSLAPNGSTIIVCGHDQGVFIVWRGGRPFRPTPQAEAAGRRTNGTSKNQMLMDTEEDESPARSTMQELFEDQEDEVDSAKPYYQVVQELDLPLSTGALKIAFPRIPPSTQNLEGDISPKVLQEKLVVAIACADSTLRLLTLPLMPPSPQSKNRVDLDISLSKTGRGSWGEQLITIPAASSYQGLPKAISVAFMPSSMSPDVEDEMEEEEEAGEEKTGDPLNHTQITTENEWDVLLASCSSDQGGQLSIHKMPLSEDGTSIEEEAMSLDVPWRSESLTRAVESIDFYVPTASENEQSPYILLAESNGAVRVYDCCALSRSHRGRWIVSLYAGYEEGPSGRVPLRTLLDAKWVLGGSAIAALMADGEWGIWNLGFNRANGSNAEIILPISASIPTKFSLSGWIGGPAVAANIAKSSTGKLDARSKLAPMTPHTRKVKQVALFTGHSSHSSISTSGGISILPTGKSLSGRREDETILLWSGDRILLIPSLYTYWTNKLKGSGNFFGTSAAGQPRDISGIDVGGELRNAVSIFPSRTGRSPLEQTSRHTDLLVSGDRSLFILASPLQESTRSTAGTSGSSPTMADQQLLSRRELDVNGMDRILDSMDSGQQLSSTRMSGTIGKRKVIFAGSR
ncbi:hypothetical protein MMC13_005757 [Lambiella insularis]|nr:hypothetical protein [Lambiella insularis]